MINWIEDDNMSIQERTREALADPENWATDLGLPLIKRGDPDTFFNRQVGVAVYLTTGEIRLYQNANLFMDPCEWKDPITLTIEEVVANKWEID